MRSKPIITFALMLFATIAIYHTAVGQTRPTLQVLTPPPPDVSALGKFGLVPVSTFSGIPDISYPIYTVKEGTLTFPVSLKYYAGGLKVKEDASEVGLGWALSASGSITSTTRGAPDFPGGFQNSYVDMPDAPDVIKTFKSPTNSIEGYYYLWNSDGHQFAANGAAGTIYSGLALPHNNVSKEYFYNFQVGYEGRAPDFASDLYHITIGDKSYKFIFDNNFKPVVLGDGSLKIELIQTSGSYPDWKVTDESGVAYYFTQRQFYSTNSTDPYYVGNRTSLTMNTWHLTKIVSPVNGEIDFNYLYNTQQFVHPLPSVSETYLVGKVSPHTQQTIESVVPSFTIYEQLNLSSITFSEGSVNFLYADQRVDLDGARRLQSIEVRNKQNKLLKKVTLDNDAYFTATAGFGGNTAFNAVFTNLSQYTSDNHYKRLKLKGIIESDSTGTNQYKKTGYTYNEQLNLPAKLSLAIDHWGYYNGPGNAQLVPPANIMLNGVQQSLPGANRNANPDYMQANVLTGITYPTGGTTTFNYETNQYQQQDLVTTYYDSIGDGYKASGSSTMNYSSLLNSTGSFTAGTWGNKRLGIFCLVDRHGTYPSNYDLNIVVYQDGVFLKRIATSASSYTPVIDSSIVINAGSTYKFVFEPFTQDFYNNCEIRFEVSVKATSSSSAYVLNTYYSGGLRVSKISSFDPVSQITNIKKYSYFDGSADDIPIYQSQEGMDFYLQNGAGGNMDDEFNVFRYRYGQSVYPFSDGRDAAFFGYGKVQVSESDQNNLNGVTEFTYNKSNSLNVNTMLYYSNGMSNQLGNYSGSNAAILNPIIPAIPSVPFGRGDLTEEKHYKSVGSNLVAVSMNHYYYDRGNPPKIWQFLFNSGLSAYTSPGFDNGQYFLIYAHQFAVPVYRNVLQRKEHFEYDQAGNTSLSSFESYVYDQVNGHYQLIKKSTGTSKGDTLNTYFKYPQDYPDLQAATSLDSASMGIKRLQQTHMIVPLETYAERVIMSPTVTRQYSGGLLNIFNPDLPTLKQVQALETVAPLSSFAFSTVASGVFSKNGSYASRLRLKYDNLGRPLQQYLERGKPTTYIWGNGLLFPMAQISNAGLDVTAYTSLEADGDGGWSVPSATRVAAGVTGSKSYNLSLGALSKSGLTSANTYVVSYWTQSAAPLSITGTISGYSLNGPNTKGWYYHEHRVTGVTSVSISGAVNIDEVRLYPLGAQMTTYTYLPLVGITNVMDAKSQATYYEYDDFQRLINIKDKDGYIIKHTDYHYLNQ
ncbi:RHS repeat protein [Mucilaginibacter ginsenosidivorax]|uniref:RHS repeat protein n=1 Tax=Mucilaginibacter ginsenosidivorax TaxID=862126 RepID=A0A5B8W5G6_9SPHI|nr:RHS repeat protein [Mucilaginibacter ginsenosidivorax]QEC79310.1 RHS repeat protein [Mucilaginibacter ginsenosidivorax]